MGSVDIVNFNEQSTKLTLPRFNKRFSLKKSIDKAIAVVVTPKSISSSNNQLSTKKNESKKIIIMDNIEKTNFTSSSPVKTTFDSSIIPEKLTPTLEKSHLITPTSHTEIETEKTTTTTPSPKSNNIDCSLTHENMKCVGSNVTNDTTTNNPITTTTTHNNESCRHDGRELINAILPINIDSLFELLHSNSKFLADFHEEQKITETQHEEWKLNDENQQQKCRKFICKMPTKQNFGPKYSHIFEEQVLNELSIPGKLYPVDILLWNEGVPYGEAFEVYKHHCFVKIDDNHTQFSVHMQIKFKKPIFLLVKAVIEKTAYKGMGELYADMVETLNKQFGNNSDNDDDDEETKTNGDDTILNSEIELSRCTSSSIPIN